MNEMNKTFDEKLLGQEKINPSLKERHEKEKKKMLEKNISISEKEFIGLDEQVISEKVCLGVLLFIGIFFNVYFFTTLFKTLPMIPPDNMIRITYPFVILGLLLSIAWVILLVYLIISGNSNSRINLSLIIGIGLAIGFILTVLGN